MTYEDVRVGAKYYHVTLDVRPMEMALVCANCGRHVPYVSEDIRVTKICALPHGPELFDAARAEDCTETLSLAERNAIVRQARINYVMRQCPNQAAAFVCDTCLGEPA